MLPILFSDTGATSQDGSHIAKFRMQGPEGCAPAPPSHPSLLRYPPTPPYFACLPPLPPTHKVSPKSTDPVPLYSVYRKFQNVNKVFLDSRLGHTLSCLVAEKSEIPKSTTFMPQQQSPSP